MAVRLNLRGTPAGGPGRVVGRVTRVPVADNRGDHVLLGAASDPDGYAAMLVPVGTEAPIWSGPTVTLADADHLRDGWIVMVDGAKGFVRVLFRPESEHNVLFATVACDSACLMCSQPPLPPEHDDRAAWLKRLVHLIAPAHPPMLGITGGEPLLLGHGLADVIRTLKEQLSDTWVPILSNGRRLADGELARRLADVEHPRVHLSIPLHGDVPELHDFVAQRRGAFAETVAGLLNAAGVGLRVEIRVILQRPTVARLGRIAEFIWSSLPFVEHVAFMGLEPMGYARPNRSIIWESPADYGSGLAQAVEYLHRRCVPVSLYNLPLCLVPPALWGFARRSISDFKQVYIPECARCAVSDHCCGLFVSDATSFRPMIRSVSPALREAAESGKVAEPQRN